LIDVTPVRNIVNALFVRDGYEMLLARRSPHRTTYSGLCSAISSAAFWYACVRAGQTPPMPLELIL